MERQRDRDQRYPYETSVQLLIPFDPWFLRLCLRGHNISTSGLLTAMNPLALGPGVSLEDLSLLLNEGDPYQIQLTSPFDHIESSIVDVRLRRRQTQSNVMMLAFSFEEQNEPLYSLIHELKQSSRRIAKRS